MGFLTDEPTRGESNTAEGDKFVRLFREVFDDDDREMFRSWIEQGVGTTEAHRRLCRVPEFRMGRSSVERGVARLKAVAWDSSQA